MLALPGRLHAVVPRGRTRLVAAQAPGKWSRGGVPGVASSRSRWRRRRRRGGRRRRGLVPLRCFFLRLCHGDVCCSSEHAVAAGFMTTCGHCNTLPSLHLHAKGSLLGCNLELACWANFLARFDLNRERQTRTDTYSSLGLCPVTTRHQQAAAGLCQYYTQVITDSRILNMVK